MITSHRRILVLLVALLPAFACGKSSSKEAPTKAPPPSPQVPLIALPMRLRMTTRLEMVPMKDSTGCSTSGKAIRLEPFAYSDSLKVAFFATSTEVFFAPDTLPGHDQGWTYGVWRLDAENSGGQWAPSDTGPRLVAFAAKTSTDSTINLHALVTQKGRGLKLEDRWRWVYNEGAFNCMPPVSPGDIMASLRTPLRTRARAPTR